MRESQPAVRSSIGRFALMISFVAMANAGPSWADDAEIVKIKAAWAECEKLQADAHVSWNGWHNDFQNGYADTFEFRRADPGVSVLQTSRMVDSAISQTDTSCFRADGTLAFILSEKTVLPSGDKGETRLYFSPAGAVIKNLRTYLHGAKSSVKPTEAYAASEGRCCAIDLYRTAAAVQLKYESVLGDIEGHHPNFDAETISADGQSIEKTPSQN